MLTPASGPATPAFSTAVQVSHVRSTNSCGSGFSAGLLRKPETIVRWSRYGASGSKIFVIW